MTQKHTPTPWSDDFEKGNGEITHRATGMPIAVCVLPNDGVSRYGEMREIRHDNAVFIVEAINTHRDLVALAGRVVLASRRLDDDNFSIPADVLEEAKRIVRMLPDPAINYTSGKKGA